MAFDKLWKIVIFSLVGSIISYLLFAYIFDIHDLFWEGFIPTLFIPLVLSSIVGNFILKANKEIKESHLIIKEQTEQLKQDNQLKTRLLSILSHDIRSPLSSLKGILDLSDNSEISPSTFIDFKSKIKERLKDTERILENTLVWIKHQQVGVEVKTKEIDLEQLLQTKYNSFKSDLSAKNIKFNFQFNHVADPVADKIMLQMILRNLISNAIKFTPDDGTIEIETSTTDDYTAICVKDTGVGLNSTQVEKLSNYETLESSRGTRGEKGFGIGLETTLKLIQLNNAQLIVNSKLGKGSTFEVRLPIAS